MGNDHLDAQTSARLFRRALTIKGDKQKLATSLAVRVAQLDSWLAARTFPPQEIFEKVLEIILDAYENRLAGDDPGRAGSVRDERPASRKPRALVAETASGAAAIAAMLRDDFDVVPVHTESEALDVVQGSAAAGRPLDLIVCGQHFEGSQMLDFLQCVKAYAPTSRIPFICCRVLPTQLSKAALAAMRETCELLGALAYIDVVGAERAQGAAAAAVEFRDAARAAAAQRADAAPERILVVDDNADAAHTLTVLLRMAGHQVEKASSGGEALRIAAEFRPRVVVLDIAMPGMRGDEVARRLRAEPWGREALLIAVSGHAAGHFAPATLEAFDHYFVKPVDVSQLIAIFSKSKR